MKKQINSVTVWPLARKSVTDVKKALVCAGRLYVLGTDGRVYCAHSNFCMTIRPTSAGSQIDMLVRFGLIDRKTAKAWIAAATLERVKAERKYAAERFARDAKVLGMRLTDAQRKHLVEEGAQL